MKHTTRPLNPGYLEPPGFSIMARFLGFASIIHCNLTPDFSNPRFFETIDISNQCLPPMEEISKKFTSDFSSPQEVLLGSFHLNGHTLARFYSHPPITG